MVHRWNGQPGLGLAMRHVRVEVQQAAEEFAARWQALISEFVPQQPPTTKRVAQRELILQRCHDRHTNIQFSNAQHQRQRRQADAAEALD